MKPEKSKKSEFDSKNNELANNIAAILKEKQISESDLAKAIEVPYNTVHRLVTGFVANPGVLLISKISDFLGISVDALLNGGFLNTNIRNKPTTLPVFSWTDLEYITLPKLDEWKERQTIFLDQSKSLSSNAFILQANKSMEPRYPDGTCCVIDPDALPRNTDTLLINLLEDRQLSLRKLTIDPPQWYLYSLIEQAHPLVFNKESHKILGVVIMTMLFRRETI